MTLSKSRNLRAMQEINLRLALGGRFPSRATNTKRRIEQLKDELALRKLETSYA